MFWGGQFKVGRQTVNPGVEAGVSLFRGRSRVDDMGL